MFNSLEQNWQDLQKENTIREIQVCDYWQDCREASEKRKNIIYELQRRCKAVVAWEKENGINIATKRGNSSKINANDTQ
ncbi:41485_t:CDS:2 [Gigaspora margarita]|uniref:41485_t:CDS:1 n=1 Tax=Gigaspora margarita TaxID=4874 RepID=A0ABN7VM99_GIGMA|nr:41485_t:CDS:2 [Gigaspora margarita]